MLRTWLLPRVGAGCSERAATADSDLPNEADESVNAPCESEMVLTFTRGISSEDGLRGQQNYERAAADGRQQRNEGASGRGNSRQRGYAMSLTRLFALVTFETHVPRLR